MRFPPIARIPPLVVKGLVNAAAIVFLGLVLPAVLLLQSYYGLHTIAKSVDNVATMSEVVKTYRDFKSTLGNANDYALFSMLSGERANLRTMANKQVMKISIMQIGFAVISVGMMFIVLGIDAGGATVAGTAGVVNINVVVGSTGVLIFLIGAGMATAGGVIPNEYRTMSIPQYVLETPDSRTIAYLRLQLSFKQCSDRLKSQGDQPVATCFANAYRRAEEALTGGK